MRSSIIITHILKGMTSSAHGISVDSITSIHIYSNIITAVASSTVTLFTFILLDHPINPWILLVVFSGTLVIYTLNRFTDLREDTINLPHRVRFIRKYGKTILLLAIILYLLSLTSVALHSSLAGIVAILPLFIAFTYSNFRLKRYFLVKIYSHEYRLGMQCPYRGRVLW